MVFSGLLFTFYFLPVVLVLYYIVPRAFKNYILLVSSIFFYSYGEPRFVFVMLLSIIVNYFFGLFIDRSRSFYPAFSRPLLIADVIFNLSILFIFKYLDFSIGILDSVFGLSITEKNIALPIGISFFTFQALSYVIDVYRGRVKVQKNPFYVALYISFFPQLIAGPIVRYSTIEDQIDHRIHSPELFSEGVRRFMLGFCKKVILANNLGVVSADLFGMDPASTEPTLLWIGSVCYTLQIFYDFSGYSDMAIGLGKMFGFNFDENFNYPYIAGSVTDFWRRWHISLSSWFRDYVYIPLGGSKVSAARHILNLFTVWILTGIWHGANYTFIVWGLFYFVLLVFEKYALHPEKKDNIIFCIFWRIATLLCVNFAWVIFNSQSISYALSYITGMFKLFTAGFSLSDTVIYYIREYGFFMAAGLIFSTPVAKKLSGTKPVALIRPIGYGLVFLWAVSFLVLGAHNPFIYFNF